MTAPIRFGFGIDLRNPEQWYKPFPELYAEHLDFLAFAESLGFEQVWLAEHHGIEDGYLPSPLVVGAAIAARTKKIRISTGVGLLPNYHPVRLAEDMAVLDILSNGRAEFAFGLGYLQHEADAYGFDQKSRGRIADEMLQIIRPLWQGQAVTFDGEFFHLKNARITPLPVQKPGIPLFVGAAARPGFRRAARYADGFVGGAHHYPLYVEEARKLGKDEKSLRYASMGTDMWFIVSEDPEKTFEEVAPHAYYQINKYGEWQADVAWGFKATPFDEFKKSGILKVYTPEEAIAHIRARIAEIPLVESYCMQAPAGYPLSKLAVHAELFAKKVLPAFR
jgi:alkanesulfonate monooxygenase SsuD/methylene tetrahydromethanopterin reductase-like flavin-dependent oxidoreductase (luciferase family)